jgi:hypothetical protein
MLHSLVLSVTFGCPIKCRFCGVHAGPHRKDRMSLEFMKKIIDDALRLGTLELVVFTGGEPFLLGEDLYAIVHYASEKRLLTRIVSNAYWATSYKRAKEIIARLKKLGLTEINYSCDDFHQELIPIERIRWANDAAAELGMPALLAVKGIKDSRINPSSLEELLGHKLTNFIEGSKKNPRNFVYSYGVTIPVGWGCNAIKDHELLWPADDATWQGPCKTVLENIVISPNGDLSVCCGIGSDNIPETIIGNVNQHRLVDILSEGNNDLILNWLALEGPFGIMRFVQQKVPHLTFKQHYVNTCHLCHDLFSRDEVRDVIAAHCDERIPLIAMKRATLETRGRSMIQKHKNKASQKRKEYQNGRHEANL